MYEISGELMSFEGFQFDERPPPCRVHVAPSPAARTVWVKHDGDADGLLP